MDHSFFSYWKISVHTLFFSKYKQYNLNFYNSFLHNVLFHKKKKNFIPLYFSEKKRNFKKKRKLSLEEKKHFESREGRYIGHEKHKYACIVLVSVS